MELIKDWRQRRTGLVERQQRTTGSATPEPHPYTEPSRSGTPAVPPFPDGIKVLHDCADAAVDICFVHGLTGDRESTWTAPGHSVPWPSTLLPPRLRGARILTYGYDAYVMRRSVASMNRLIDHKPPEPPHNGQGALRRVVPPADIRGAQPRRARLQKGHPALAE